MVSEPAVFSVGTVNADFALSIDAPLERGASLIARRLLRTSGGRAANVAVMARRLATLWTAGVLSGSPRARRDGGGRARRDLSARWNRPAVGLAQGADP